jgi:hypothetical protein
VVEPFPAGTWALDGSVDATTADDATAADATGAGLAPVRISARPPLDSGLPQGCSAGTVSIASDILNPGDVYILGTFSPGETAFALSRWTDPNVACDGFPDYVDPISKGVIRPTDGRLLFVTGELSTPTLQLSTPALLEYHDDGVDCPTYKDPIRRIRTPLPMPLRPFSTGSRPSVATRSASCRAATRSRPYCAS